MRILEAATILALLAMFFAYLLAPAMEGVQRRVRIGRRKRPLARVAALTLLYAVLFVPALVAWRFSGDAVKRWVQVTAPESVDRLFGGGRFEPLDRAIAHAPISADARRALRQRLDRGIGYVEREARSTLRDLIAAAPYARWLVVAPVLAFVLLTGAPSFRRSTVRVLPRGHLQWRGEEYLRDVNSALAGYVRAQTAAGVIVGSLCVAGFVLLGIPSAVSMGVAAGVLELVPAIGPLTALLVAVTRAGDQVLAVVAFLGALRLVQDYAIYPRLIRHGMHLSTPAVIVTIWFGAALAGAAGVILAIPIAGFVSVSLRHLREYRALEQLVRTHEPRR